MKKPSIALVQGGPGPEREISLKTASAVTRALEQLGYKYFIAEANQELPQLLISKKPDVAFLALHGMYGEDGLVQALCESLQIPYTGSGVLCSALCMDKIFFKQLFTKHKFPIPDFQVVDFNQPPPNISSYPAFVKSSHGGSSLGTFMVRREKDLGPAIKKARELGAGVFIEEGLPNCREIAVSFLDNTILTPVEIEPKGGFYDYKRKYVKGESSYFVPPKADPLVVEKIKRLAQKAFHIASARSYARADFLLEKNTIPWLIEINTLPGLTEHSLLPKSAEHEGISFAHLIETIIKTARTDYTHSV